MAIFGRPSERDEAREMRWRLRLQRQNPLAVASVVLSVFSLTHLGTLLVDTLAGIALGVVALRQIARARAGKPDAPDWRAKTDGDKLAWAGIVVGAIMLAMAFYLYFLAAPR